MLVEVHAGVSLSGKPVRPCGIAVFLRLRYHLAATSGIIPPAGRLALRVLRLL
jgi:hypothetical protein